MRKLVIWPEISRRIGQCGLTHEGLPAPTSMQLRLLYFSVATIGGILNEADL
jgi:hypothetical protein